MPGKTHNIVLINDDNVIREMMKLCLETIPNCKVIVVNSGVEAIELAATEKIDVILLDIDERMLEQNCLVVIKTIKQAPSTNQVPLILLTWALQSQEMIKLQQTKEIKAIAKSFDLLHLANEISTLLGWKQ